jgi:hypothetical protein
MTALDGPGTIAVVRQALANGTAHEKGGALELAIRTLVSPVPGVIAIELHARDAFASEEIDLVIGNDPTPGGFSFLPDVFLVECKNWAVPVGAPEIKLFGAKLRERSCTFGIFVAACGITGSPSERLSGNGAIADALKDGVRLIVLTLADLEGIQSTDDLVNLIRSRIMKLVGSRGQL